MTQTKTNSIHEDFLWIIKILHSSKNDEHLSCTLKCFRFWEMKHIDKILTKTETDGFNGMRSVFWDEFKNQNRNIGMVDSL